MVDLPWVAFLDDIETDGFFVLNPSTSLSQSSTLLSVSIGEKLEHLFIDNLMTSRETLVYTDFFSM